MSQKYGNRRTARQHGLNVCFAIAAISLYGVCVAPAGADGGRAWTVVESVRMKYLTGNQIYPYLRTPSEAIRQLIASPNGKYFFFTTSAGDIQCDCNVMELQIFAVEDFGDLSKLPKPRRSVIMRSQSADGDRAAISQVRWESEGDSLVFVGVNGDGPGHVYRMDISSGRLTQLTQGPHSVFRYFWAVRGNATIFAEEDSRPSAIRDEYPAVTGLTATLLRGLLDQRDSHFRLYVEKEGSEPKLVGTTTALPSDSGPWMAPDGMHAIFAYAPEGSPPPVDWRSYDGIADLDRVDNAESIRHLRVRRFNLVDVASGQTSPVFDAPTGTATRMGMSWNATERHFSRVYTNVLWSKDSTHAVLVNTALPLTENLRERRQTAYIVDYEVATGAFHVLEALESVISVDAQSEDSREGMQNHVSRVSWLKQGTQFVVEHKLSNGSPSSATVYTFREGKWAYSVVSAAAAMRRASPAKNVVKLKANYTAFVRETNNEPFTILVSNGTRTVPISEPDPALKDVWRARIDLVKWKNPDGHIEQAGLMLPYSALEASSPLPLVIQIQPMYLSSFRPDGPDDAAYAAQPLAGAGMAVLLVEPAASGSLLVSSIDSVVALLAKKGIADSSRVALIGVGDSLSQVLYVVTHPGRTRIAAAILAEGHLDTFDEYVFQGVLRDSSVQRPAAEVAYGGSFWGNKSQWLQTEPIFNADRAQAPLMFSCQGLPECRAVLGTLGAFKLNEAAVDLIAFPRSGVQLIRPRERLTSLQGTVNWMSFWLLDRDDLGENEGGTYVRWKRLREKLSAGN